VAAHAAPAGAAPGKRSALATDGLADNASKDLDARILDAELRVIAGDENARRRLEAIGSKLAALPRPRDLLWPAAGVVSAGAALAWVWRRLGRGKRLRRHGPQKAAAHGGHGERDSCQGGGGLPWVQLIGLAWPLLPGRWRSRVDPSTSSAVLAFGLPLLQAALARHEGHKAPKGPPVQAVGPLDLERYAGTWFEVARLPAPFEAVCKGQPTATYTPQPDGTLSVVNRCHVPGGHEASSEGIALVVPGSGGSKLEVSLFPRWLHWLPFAWADYWVIAIDTDYRCALVGDPRRRFLWVLSRTPELAQEDFDELLAIAQQQGFDLEKLKVNVPA
jgi:apolipoprotein D and lipocalin family protein